MKFKKIMLVSIILLAILTVGAVSANDDVDFNETLTVDDVQETVDVSLDEEGISEDSDGVVASSDSDVLADGEEEQILEIYINREFSTTDDLDEIFAAVTVPEGTQGNVTISIYGNVLYNKAISDFDESRIDGSTYGIALGGDDGNFIFDGYGQDDMILFSFLYENGDSLTRVYFINLENNTISFDNDDSDSPDNYETFEGLSVFIMDLMINEPYSVIKVSEWPEGIDDYFDIRLQKDGEEPITTPWDINSVDRDRAGYAMWNIEQLQIHDEGEYSISFIFTVGGVEKIIEVGSVDIGSGDDDILWIDTEGEFSINPEDLDEVFATIRVSPEMNGRIIFRTDDDTLYEKHLMDFPGEYIEGDHYNIILRDYDHFIFENLNDGDGFQFAFIDDNDGEIACNNYFIHFLDDNKVSFEKDEYHPAEDVRIDVECDFDSNDDENHFAWVHLPEDISDGKFIVTAGNVLLLETNVGDDEYWWIEEEKYLACGITPKDIDWTKLNEGDIVTFSFIDENDETLASREFEVTIDGDQIHLDECASAENFNWWISTHECENEDESFISEVWFHDVDEGVLILSIENSAGDIQTYERSVEETDNVHWELKELDIIDETGAYTVNLTYSNNGRNIVLEENHIFKLTELYYNVCENVYVEYPFDVIRFYSEEDDDGEALYDVKVYVNDEEREFGGEYPYRWTLNDLEIENGGEYDINIKVYEDDVLIEEFSYILNVDDNQNELRLYSSDLSVESWEMDGPVLYLVYPEDMDETFTMRISDDEDNLIDEFDVDSSMNWTLDELGIDHDGNYNIQLLNERDDQVIDVWVSVWCIDRNKIKTWTWDTEEDGELYNDTESKIISVEVPEDKYGDIVITVNGENVVNWEIDEDNRYQEWTLDDLGMTEVGEYDVIVEYIGDESEEILANVTLNVIEFDYNTFRAIINTNKRQIEVYCPEDCEGEINIRIIEGDVEDEFNFIINDSYKGVWTTFSFTDLNVLLTNDYEIILEMDEYRCEKEVNRWVELSIWNGEDERGPLYDDSQGNVINVYIPDSGKSATLWLILDSELKFITKLSKNRDVSWDLKQLNLTESVDLELKFVFEGDVSESIFNRLNIESFENDTNRAKIDIENSMIDVFAVPGSQNLTINIYDDWEDPIFYYAYDFHTGDYNTWKEIPLSGFGLEEGDWCLIEVIIDDDYSFSQGFRIPWEDEESPDDPELHYIDDDGNVLEHDDDAVFSVSVPADFVLKNASINVTSGDYEFFKNLTEIMPVWYDGRYNYEITFGDLDRFETLEDKAIIKVTLKYDAFAKNESYVAINSREFILKKTDSIAIFEKSVMDDDWICIDTDEMHDDELVYDVNSDGDRLFAYVMIPDIRYPSVSDGKIIIYSGEEVIFERYLSDYYDSLDPKEYMGYDYPSLGVIYKVFFRELDLTKAKDKDLVSIQFVAQNYDDEDRAIVYHIADEDTVIFYDAGSSISLDDEGNLGNVDDIEYIAQITISDDLNDEGYLSIVCGDRVLFNRTLDEIKQDETYDKMYSYSNRGYIYYIPKGDMLDDLKDGDVLKFTLYYDGEVDDYYEEKVIENGTEKYIKATISPADVFDKFGINITDQKLVNLENGTLNLITFDGTNRQTIDRKLRNGYFCVYVNGVKVENLGKLLHIDEGEAPITELELFWLCAHENKNFTLTVENLGITENGEYDILVTYVPEISDPGDLEYNDYREINVTSLNVELTSNVKANYENESVEWLTGYGVDPILMYLDTYYGDINATTGVITVLNSDNVTILEKNIKDMTYEGGRYLLRYSDFENKDFGDKITVKYSDGNERNGETSLDVKWRDVDPTDFNTTVMDDINDYYGNFINLNIPELINTGQIIVTIKFKNNHGSNISNMSVDTDFDSKAVYRFNVADIKANYGNDFALALYDLGFYEDNGNYDIDVKFTADNVNVLNVTSSALNVEFLKDIIITINETSRYAHSEPFATVRVFEPVTAYGELYIDGKFYDKKSFERGLITFISSKDWTVGTHQAEVRVLNSEFGSILNSSAVEFETLAHSEDVTVEVSDEFGANEHAIVYITVPKAGNVTVQIDKAAAEIRQLSEGLNQIDLGILPYGNHRLWIEYEEVLDDGNVTFYSNYHSFFVSDDGRWLIFPDPLVLNDDDTIIIDLGSDSTGYILIYIDEELVKNATLVNGHAEYVVNESIFTDTLDSGVLGASNKEKYGKHTYKIYYSGDKTHEPITREGEFTVAYIFKDDLAYEYPYKESYDITVTLPGDANGQVRLTVNNNPQTSQVTDGKATFTVGNLPLGEHDVFIEYLGGDYPESSYHAVLNISHYGVIGEYSDSAKYVSLLLPTNATGNLTVYNDDRKSILCSVPVVEGKARIDLSKVSVGIYDIRAYYEGDDYDVRDFEISFKVMPKVNITQNAIIDEDVVIFVDLDNATGFLLIIMDGLSPVLEELTDGIVNYTLKTENYSYGDHRVNFMYIGNSFNGDVFNEFNETTGRYVAIDYDMKILCQNLTSKTSSDGDEWLIVDCGNATGTLQVFLDGTLWQVVEIVNGLARINIAGLSNGEHNLTFLYSGDRKFGSALLSILLSVKHKVPRIDAGNFNIDYSSKKAYSVIVYKKDGSIASGVAVTFLINNKSYGNVLSNSKGVASIVISSAPGSYKITSKALGVSVTKQLNVKKILSLKKVTVKRSAKKLVIKATLKKVDGKYLKGKKIIFKFKGKKYTAKTNKKGVAKVTIKKKVLKKLKKGKKVTYQATYLKGTVKRTVKVKK